MTSPGNFQPSEPSHKLWSTPLWGAKTSTAIDHLSTTLFHIEAVALMETAGRAVAAVANKHHVTFKQVIIVSGTGNNGADGLVAARVLFDLGWNTKIFIVRSATGKPSDLFTLQLKTVQALRIPLEDFSSEALHNLRQEHLIVIDALTGAGFSPPLSQQAADALTAISQLPFKRVIAIDLPSGLAADDGSAATIPLQADETVTFGAAKPAHKIQPSASHCGVIHIEDIGFPEAAISNGLSQNPPTWRLALKTTLLEIDPWRELPQTANKYDRGHVLVIGGSEGKMGAPILAGLAALRAGAGWSSLAVPKFEFEPDVQWPLELTFESFFDGQQFENSKFDDFLNQRRVNTVVIGPGWMSNHLTRKALEILITFCERGGKVVIDAGGLHQILNLIQDAGPLPRNSFVFLPHPGEWRKLSSGESLLHPLEPITLEGVTVTHQLSQRFNLTLCHKGATPVVMTESIDSAIVCDFGSLSLARAGSGDVLAGVVAAHLAMGCSPLFAVCRSYAIVAEASVAAGKKKGFHAVLASDIVNFLGRPTT